MPGTDAKATDAGGNRISSKALGRAHNQRAAAAAFGAPPWVLTLRLKDE